MNRVDWNKSQSKIAVEVLIRRDVPAATLQPHFHVDLSTLGDGADIDILIQNLYITISFDHARSNNTSGIGTKV